MKFHFKGKKMAKNLVAVASCGAMMVAFAPTAAMADTISDAISGSAMSADGYVTCAAARAAMPAPEILGLSGIEDNGDSFSKVSTWTSPKYLLLGSDYNSNPNPYMYNNMLVATGKDTSASPTVIVNTGRSGAQGPMAALGTYGTTTGEDAILEAKPDVILGTLNKDGSNADYDTAAYAGAVDANWHPKSVAYGMATMDDMISMMYRLADAGDAVVKESNNSKKLRYGSAEAIAQNFEKYVAGTRGYILKRLKDDGKKIKTVAVVSAVNSDGTVTLTASGKAEGTSSKNRYLEATESVATNYGDTHQTATLSELKKNVDLVLIGGQAGNSGEGLTDSASISATLGADILKNTYFVNSSTSSAGSMYGVVMNSPENAQNIGRILGCLYPEYVDQDDWIAYYYDKFYHVKSSKLADAIDNAMDGVVNWDATGSDRTQWTTADASTYKRANVQRKIDTGVQYLQTLSASKQGANKLTSHIKKTTVSKVKQTISVKPAKATASSKKASTISLKATAQGKLSYKVTKKASNKVSVSKTGKVSVKKGAAKGKYVVTVTAGAAGEYKAATKTVTITVK